MSKASKVEAPIRASSTPIWREILKNLGALDLGSKLRDMTIDDVDLLSSRTIVEDLELDPDAAVSVGSTLILPGTLFVELNYGSDDDAKPLHEAFPVSITIENTSRSTDQERPLTIEEVDLAGVEVDTRKFFL